MALAERRPALMTVEAFLAWDGGGHQGRLELVDGQVRAMAPASGAHGMIQGNLAFLLGAHLRRGNSPCRFGTEVGIVPHMDARHNLRVPDLTVSCEPHQPGEKVFPRPVLIVEIFSPSNRKESHESLLAAATIPSLREIVTFESERMAAELFRRDAQGHWPQQGTAIGPGGMLELQTLGFSFPLEEAYRGVAAFKDDSVG